MSIKKNYQLGRIGGRLKIEFIHSKSVFGNVEVLSMCLVVSGSRHIRISGVCKDKMGVVMAIGVCEGQQNLKVSRRTLVLLGNIR